MEYNKALFEAQIQNKDVLEEQFEVKRWLQWKNEDTQHTYRSALKAFTEYTRCTPKELIDLAEEDRKKAPEKEEPDY